MADLMEYLSADNASKCTMYMYSSSTVSCTCHRLPRGVGPWADMGTLTNLYFKDLVFPHTWGINFLQSPQYKEGGKHPTRPNLGESRLCQQKQRTLLKYELELKAQ